MTPIPGPTDVETDGDYVHVRYRDPEHFETLRTPAWAEEAAASVVDGGEVRLGKPPDGDGWVPVSVLVPAPVDADDARRLADEVLQRIEH